jgi:hypothetical protein
MRFLSASPPKNLRNSGAARRLKCWRRKIAAEGQMTLWQCGVKRDAKGQMAYAAIGKVSVFAAGVVRIEPLQARL